MLELMETDLQQVINLNCMYDAKTEAGVAVRKSYLMMMLSGLSHLHQMNVIHRDVKPNNLLISSRGILKLSDFGMSRFLPASTGAASSAMCDELLSTQVVSRYTYGAVDGVYDVANGTVDTLLLVLFFCYYCCCFVVVSVVLLLLLLCLLVVVLFCVRV